MKMTKEDMLKKFEIENLSHEIRPYYKINIEMDANDGDYICVHRNFWEDEWKALPLVVLYCLSYVSDMSSNAKFNDDIRYGYGRHVTSNRDFPWICSVMSDFGLIAYSNGFCHSYTSISVEHHDRNGVVHNVKIPDFDVLFEDCTKEEMVAEMTSAYDDYDTTGK